MARSGRDDLDTTDDNLSAVVRWGWYSIGVTLILVAVHCLIAIASGSLAVMAELLHTFVDLASAGVLVAGLEFAARKTAAFPYGLYKIENLVATGLAMMIFFTAYEIVSLVFLERGETPDVDVWMLASLGVTTLVPLAFSHFELRVAHRTNSPALLADAREYRVHVYTTGLTLAALLTAWFALPFDQVAALIIAAAVVKTGWDLLADAFRVLLDASLDATSLGKIRRIIGSDPAISDVNWITGRNAERYRFVGAGITSRLADLVKAQVAIRRIETAVRSAMPQVERMGLGKQPSGGDGGPGEWTRGEFVGASWVDWVGRNGERLGLP